MSMSNALRCYIGGARATGGMALYVHGQLHSSGFEQVAFISAG